MRNLVITVGNMTWALNLYTYRENSQLVVFIVTQNMS